MPGLNLKILAKLSHKIRHIGNSKGAKSDPPMGSTSSRDSPKVAKPSPHSDVKGDPEQKPASAGPVSSPNVDKEEGPDILDSLTGATSVGDLEAAQQHAPVPYLADASSLASSIFDAFMKTHGNKGDLKSLAEDCVRIVSTVKVTCEELTKDNHPLPQDLINNLRELWDNLRSIEIFAKKRAQRHFVKRFLLQDNDLGAIENYRTKLKQALDTFSSHSIQQEHDSSTPIGSAAESPSPSPNFSEGATEPVRIDCFAQKPRIEVVDVDRDRIASQSSPAPNVPMTEPQLKSPGAPAGVSSPHNPPVNPKKEDSSGSARPTSDNSSSATTFFSGAHNFSMSGFRLNSATDDRSGAATFFAGAHNFSMSGFSLNSVTGDQHNVENSDNRNVYHEDNSNRQRFSSPGGYNRPGPTREPSSRDSTWPDSEYGGWTGGGPGNDFDRPGFDQRMSGNRYADYGRANTRGSYYGGAKLESMRVFQ